MIKLIKYDGDWIVATIEEIPDVEFGDPDCILKYPVAVSNDLELSSYPYHSSDTELIVRSSNIFIICEPNDKLIARYNLFIEKK